MVVQDLNDAKLINDRDGRSDELIRSPFISGPVEVHFSDIEDALIRQINRSDVTVGCVAWFTSDKIIHALSRVKSIILVQKEDFLRPDTDCNDPGAWKTKLRRMYSQLNSKGLSRFSFPFPMCALSTLSYDVDEAIQPVRVVGITGNDRSRPRMHHKFAVFCRFEYDEINDDSYEVIVPYAVWTGSFNFTQMASRSLENAVLIRDQVIAERYLEEFAYCYALSEPLDWTSEYVDPEFRIGT